MRYSICITALLCLVPSVTSLLPLARRGDPSLDERAASCPKLSPVPSGTFYDRPKTPAPTGKATPAAKTSRDTHVQHGGHVHARIPSFDEAIEKRGAKVQPLDSPSLTGGTPAAKQSQMVAWMKTQEAAAEKNKIPISPSVAQQTAWRIMTSDKTEAPVGVTGFFYPWPKTVARTYSMEGLCGCTAVFAVVSL
jgi:hypothetical protein